MKNFATAIIDLAYDIFHMYLDTVSNVPEAKDMDSWRIAKKNGKTYMMHMEVSWEEI